MIGELGGGESAVDGIPQELAHDLIHLMAHQKMVVETQHILSRCEPDDAFVLVGSDVKLRLDILAIDEELDNSIHNHDPDDPSKYFERLLERFDLLRKSLANVDKPIITEKWPEMRARLVRQAALSCFLAQQRNHVGPEPFDWATVATKPYERVVNRLIPEAGVDIDDLHNEEQVSAWKEGKNLTNVFLEKRRGVRAVSSLQLRTLLKENKLSTFERDMKAFTRALEEAVLPKPKLLELYSSSRLLDDSGDSVQLVSDDRLRSPGKPSSSVASPVSRPGKRKAGSAAGEAPPTAQALAKANESLQQELQGRPGAVAEALAITEGMPSPSSPPAKRAAIENNDNVGGSSRKRPARTAARRSEKSVTRRESLGEQVDFDDSQSVDEPQDSRPVLRDRTTPPKTAVLSPPAREVHDKIKRPRSRNPWTEEEVKHLKAAVMALGKGNWADALKMYKFNPCRTSVDLKDKWRNLSKG